MRPLVYYFIRMWAPPDECSDPTVARYVARVERDDGEAAWTVVKKYTSAHYFDEQDTAFEILRENPRISGRVKTGWLFEVIRVEEEIVGSNVPNEEVEPA